MQSAAAGLVLAVLVAVAAAGNTPAGPVIGVMTQDLSEEVATDFGVGATETRYPYIAASYIKYLESAGARVVPVFHNVSTDSLTKTFSMIDGLLFPGGGANLQNLSDPFMVAATHLYALAMDENKRGGHFPLWGTCLGFQTLGVLQGGPSVLESGFDSENLPLPLQLTNRASSSRLLGSLSPDILAMLTHENTTMNNHQAGITPSTFASSEKLSSFFNVLSTNVDRKGRAFASTIESKTMPVYGTQWHPEKNCFEWTPKEDIPHSSDAVTVCHTMAAFFVNEARKSSHSYPFDTLMKDVIWNYNPIFSGLQGSGFDQIYLFK